MFVCRINLPSDNTLGISLFCPTCSNIRKWFLCTEKSNTSAALQTQCSPRQPITEKDSWHMFSCCTNSCILAQFAPCRPPTHTNLAWEMKHSIHPGLNAERADSIRIRLEPGTSDMPRPCVSDRAVAPMLRNEDYNERSTRIPRLPRPRLLVCSRLIKVFCYKVLLALTGEHEPFQSFRPG